MRLQLETPRALFLDFDIRRNVKDGLRGPESSRTMLWFLVNRIIGAIADAVPLPIEGLFGGIAATTVVVFPWSPKAPQMNRRSKVTQRHRRFSTRRRCFPVTIQRSLRLKLFLSERRPRAAPTQQEIERRLRARIASRAMSIAGACVRAGLPYSGLYSTVTDFAKFRGLSTSVPLAQAV